MGPRITKERMTAVLGLAKKPNTVWQQPFDGRGDELRRMTLSDWDAIQRTDLWNYFHDLCYQTLQPDLFRHLFPACLKFWYETLLANESASIGDADLHRALITGDVAAKMLTEPEQQRLRAFLIDGMLDPSGMGRRRLDRSFQHVGVARGLGPGRLAQLVAARHTRQSHLRCDLFIWPSLLPGRKPSIPGLDT
jgi:hypothetical protein